ncbi:disintegrin and metalloproteinase domain-containing protein 10 homolog isoform X2 [Teleopsis dalmanni]|uniref:disintegrin and metalloproteinase domain-containing protein 10 homolog isoform X2 n=1 Tax=Teleopsis dalmanni TaxID=139649 RepID=UPI0018CE237D|nr:disintegrin and metalloproteinase domain-containing protein 10 homolog isoform X2 [Teleopsis dalmanni]
MSSKCGINVAFTLIIFIIIVNGYAKDITGIEKGHNRLNEYISHYEILSYDYEQVRASHNRAKRSVTKDHIVNIKFAAHGREFHLRLKRDLNTFSDKLEIHGSNGPIDVSMDHIYEGEVLGEPNSYAFGSILDGVFEGKIITERDAYYVELAKRYFPANRTEATALRSTANKSFDNINIIPEDSTSGTSSTTDATTIFLTTTPSNLKKNDSNFHSIIYKESHVDDAYKDIREGHVGGCGITEEVSQWMENIQNSAVEELPEPMSKDVNERNQKIYKKRAPTAMEINQHEQMTATNIDDHFTYPYRKYSKEANLPFDSDPKIDHKYFPNNDFKHDRVNQRVKRASMSGRREDNKNTCSLYIQTDPLIWRHIREGIAEHDRGRKDEIDIKTREEITSLIAHHVTAVNYIYRNTKFDGRDEHRNIRFEVQRIKIDDDSACRTSYNGPHNAFCNEHMDVSNFLNLHSLENHSDFCLAYVFTYRDFTGGTLGLAWVASASGASGGICEKYKTYTETVGGQYQSTKRSLNTGIITFVNYNSRVPPKVSQLTLAHEIGHNFGSPHDFPQECRPGGMNGNFIMFASATSGDRPNNSKFSPCSIRNISNVLDVLVGNTKRDCFTASEGAFCGNKIVESGEECDCGFNEEECKDKCCYPRVISEYDFSLNSSATQCTRRAKTQCSPSQGPCCLANSCTFVPANYHQKCREETECSWSSSCNGTTAECPEPKPRDDKTKCNNGTALCIRGDCSGSICLLWNMTECFLTSQIVPQVDKRKLCELACQNGNDTGTCRSTSEFADLFGLPDGGISLRPGSPCDNFQGYCDVFLKCRAVDADGPLVRLKNMLLNRETLLTVAQWIIENWYLVVLMGIGFIIVMGIFIKCCAVHTPSSNPKKRRARRISETLRAPMNTLRRMRHPHNRGAGPRSIPPPVHEQRSHHRNHPPDWDRREAHRSQAAGVSNSIVPQHSGGSHASRAITGARNPGSSRNSRVASSGMGRQHTNHSRVAGHGYAEQPTSLISTSSGVGVDGNGNNSSTGIAGCSTRAQMPQTQHSQQQQQQQQQQVQVPHSASYYAPKDTRNKFRSTRSSSNQSKNPEKSSKNRRKIVY